MSRPVLRNVGVSQGSPNGSGFFSLCINDAPSVLRYCAYYLYADDLTIYIRSLLNDLHNTIQSLNDDLARLAQWAADNDLCINAKKTQLFLSQRLRSINLTEPTLDGQRVAYCNSVKILGFTLDSKLTGSQQCPPPRGKAMRTSHAYKNVVT